MICHPPPAGQLDVLEQNDQSDHGQRHAGGDKRHCQDEEPPILSLLVARRGKVISQKKIIPSIRLESDIEEIAKEWDGSSESFYSDIHQHASDRNARDAKLDCADYDIQRDQAVEDVADSRDQANDSGQPESKASRRGEGVIEPARQRLHIGNSRVDHLRSQTIRTVSSPGVRRNRLRHAAWLRLH